MAPAQPQILLAALLLGCSSSADDIPDVTGVWFRCADATCETLEQDGFRLRANGEFTELRLENDDPANAEYCEIPFGHYDHDGSRLHIEPEPGLDERQEPRSVGFEVNGDRAVLADADAPENDYLRVMGESNGNCVGVLD